MHGPVCEISVELLQLGEDVFLFSIVIGIDSMANLGEIGYQEGEITRSSANRTPSEVCNLRGKIQQSCGHRNAPGQAAGGLHQELVCNVEVNLVKGLYLPWRFAMSRTWQVTPSEMYHLFLASQAATWPR